MLAQRTRTADWVLVVGRLGCRGVVDVTFLCILAGSQEVTGHWGTDVVWHATDEHNLQYPSAGGARERSTAAPATATRLNGGYLSA